MSAAGQQTRQEFWTGYQPGFRSTDEPVGSREFFDEVERHRYSVEPEILRIADFARWRGRDVLEAGCGIATDGINFARAGARYTGIDFSDSAVSLARHRFALEAQPGDVVQGSITELPVADESQDLVYSNGVIHHIPDTQRTVDEMWRVLRPGGQALVMVYHRNSLNYWLTIMLVRRALAAVTLVPGGPSLIARLTGESRAVIAGHRELFGQYGLRYLTDGSLFLSNNTDGPGNPLSKVTTSAQALRLFHAFSDVSTQACSLNLRLYPGGDRLTRSRLGRWLEPRYGWHLWITARKAD